MVSETSDIDELIPVFFSSSLSSDIPLEFLIVLCGAESDGKGGVCYDASPCEHPAELVEKARKFYPGMSDSDLQRELNARAGPFMFRYSVALALGFEGTLEAMSLPSQNTALVCKLLKDKGIARGNDIYEVLATYHDVIGPPDMGGIFVKARQYLKKI
ncbi:MAG: hypothetical protein V1659_03790 [Candidatus Woesearchaeota archaeon]